MLTISGFGGYWLSVLLAFLANDRVDVCHPVGHGRVLELRVARPALDAHLRHGDFLPLAFFADADGDGFGDPFDTRLACEPPAGTVANADDCDDSADFVSPSDPEECGDTVDEDCSGDADLCSTESDGWTTTSGYVEEIEGGRLIGRFTFERVTADALPIRGGGACLVADLLSNDPVWGGFTCTSDAECVAAPRPAGGFVYCASPDGSDEPHRCWTRPGNVCNRSQFRGEGEFVAPALLPAGSPPPSATNPTLPGMESAIAIVPGDAGQGGVPVRWMVLSCMAVASNRAGCASTDPTQHVYSYGPVYTWTPPE